jgi:hypothetical protein
MSRCRTEIWRTASKENKENKEEQMKEVMEKGEKRKDDKVKDRTRKGIKRKRRFGRVEEEEDKNNCCYVHCPIKYTFLESERVVHNGLKNQKEVITPVYHLWH